MILPGEARTVTWMLKEACRQAGIVCDSRVRFFRFRGETIKRVGEVNLRPLADDGGWEIFAYRDSETGRLVLHVSRVAYELMIRDLPRHVAEGLQKLYAKQHQDGGWGWWEHDPTHPFLTAYVFYSLGVARKAGYMVDEERYQRAAQALENLFQRETDPSVKMYLAFALSHHRPLRPEELALLSQSRGRLHAYGLALLALILYDAKKPEEAASVRSDLYRAGVETETTWAFLVQEKGRYSWMDNDVEATAYALKAILTLDPHNPNVWKIVRWLVQRKKGARWVSTKETATAVAVLTDYLEREEELTPDLLVRVTLNGEEVSHQRVSKEALGRFQTRVSIPRERLKVGENILELVREGKGKLYYGSYLRSTTPFLQKASSLSQEEALLRRLFEDLLDIYHPGAVGA